MEKVHQNYEDLQVQYNKLRLKLEEREVSLAAKENEIKVGITASIVIEFCRICGLGYVLLRSCIKKKHKNWKYNTNKIFTLQKI
jgi:hypothetical protein